MIDRHFSAERVFSLSFEQLTTGDGKVSERVALAITSRAAFKEAERELMYCEKSNITPISRVDPQYPSLLRQIDNPPHVIFVQGDVTLLTRNLISMVGTRDADTYGMEASDKLVADVAKNIHNPVIVSGLAFGADGYAHRAALANGVPTIAVLPCALPNVMPPSHRDLANHILRDGGALISTMHSAQVGLGRGAYLPRNRVIAGLSQGTILIQSGYKGGAMQTMEMVKTMSRTAMAIPGRMTDFYSAGCNRLITLGDATSVSSAEDVIRALGWNERRKSGSNEVHKELDIFDKKIEAERANLKRVDLSTLSSEQLSLLRSMMTTDKLHVSALEKMNPMAPHKFNGLLIELELMELIESHPGALYQRVVAID